MIIKNSNQAVDVLKDGRVSWEGLKDSRRFYVKKTISYGKWTASHDPAEIPAISWEGGTTVNCKCWVERTNTIREGFSTWTETLYHYLIPSFATLLNGVTLNTTGNNEDGWTITFSKRDETSGDLVLSGMYLYSDETGRYGGVVTVKQTKRDKYVTKLDNAVITVNNIPASGGNVSSGKLTYTKTFNTGETETATEDITFSTVSATTKGTTESGITDVKTIAAGGTNQKSTTIDGVTLTHPAFTVKQAANTKTESKSTSAVILTANTNVIYTSGTVTFTTLRKYTLTYTYTSGSTLEKENQGPETIDTNGNISVYKDSTYLGNTGTSMSYKIESDTTIHTYKFNVNYDKITSNDVIVNYELDGPNPTTSKYSNLLITGSYPENYDGCHISAAGGTVYATDVDFTISFTWTYTKYSGTSESKTLTYTKSLLNTDEYKFDTESVIANNLGTTQTDASDACGYFFITVKNPKNKECNNQDTNLETVIRFSLSQQENKIEDTTIKDKPSTITANPNELEYNGGSISLTVKGKYIYTNTWTSGSTSETESEETNISSDCDFYISSSTDKKTWIPENDGDMFTKPNWTLSPISTTTIYYKFTATPRSIYDPSTCIVTLYGNNTYYTVTFNINNTYAKWYRNGSEITDTTVTKSFSEGTAYTNLIPDETPTWIEGSNYKYTFQNNYSATSSGSAVTSSSTLTSNGLTLYARWTTPAAYIKVYWDPDGGTLTKSDNSGTTTSIIYDYHGKSFSCLPSDLGYNNLPTKTDYTFISWCTNAGLVCYNNTFPISVVNSTGKVWDFYPNWAKTSITITWYSNGGVWSSAPITLRTSTTKYGSSINSYTPTPEKTSTESKTYTFKGWGYSSDSTTTISFPTTAITKEGSISYYAVYTESTRSYTITWENTKTDIAIWNDNSKAEKTSSANYDTAYNSLSAPASFADPIKNDTDTIRYTAAWYTESSGGTLLSSSTSTVTGATTVYAQLTIASYKVTLNPNSGTLTVGSTSYSSSSPYVVYVTSINLGSYTPIRSGYSFKGWASTSSATSGSTSTATISSSTTYYAAWLQVFTVTWDLNGGTYNSSTTNPTTSVESGSTVSFTTYTPTYSGYTFQGWATSSSATSGSTSGDSSAITTNTTFYATWKTAPLTPILLILAS